MLTVQTITSNKPISNLFFGLTGKMDKIIRRMRGLFNDLKSLILIINRTFLYIFPTFAP